MLGSRTKQINSYGKRSQRIVNASQSESGGRSSIFDDMPPTTLGPVASKMRKKPELNIVAKSTSPKQRPIHKKKQSPIAQPLRHKLMRAQVAHKASNPKLPTEATPIRKPLATYPLNTPGSPAISSNLLQKRAKCSSIARTPLLKPHRDIIEVDIIILDDQGKTISKERRVSKGRVSSSSSTSSDSPDIVIKKQPKRLRKRLSSDDEEFLSDGCGGRLNRVCEDSSQRDVLSSTIMPISKLAPPIRPRTPVQPPARFLAHVLVPSPSPELMAILKKAKPPSPPASPLVDCDLAYVVKPRQLTPIRRNNRNLFRPPSPPSPLNDSDLDLSMDFSGMSLGLEATDSKASVQTPPVVPEYLQPLLEECQQDTTGLHEFSAFIGTFAFDPVVRGASRTTKDLRFKKVGEASYSEVFGIGDVVLKVIPLRDESEASLSGSQKARSSDCSDMPAPSDAKDVLKEIIVTRAMGEVCERFVKLVKAYVVRGRYPEVLLELWDQYEQEHGSESVRPDCFGVSQAYAIIALPNGGPDLEAYTFSNTSMRWRQACSIFWQVAKGLARAEQLVSFEHRDLHWGQILIKDLHVPTPRPMQQQSLNTPARSNRKKSLMDDPIQGVQVTLIDLGLARMDAGDGQGGEMVHYTPFDDEIFGGSGDYQFDIYRMMKEQNQGQWEAFNPSTNVMWLHYLLTKLFQSKKLKAPAVPRQNAHTTSSLFFTERDCYECLLDIERWLSLCTAPILAKMKKTSGRKKNQATTSEAPPLCAGEVVEYGVKKRWVKSLSNL